MKINNRILIILRTRISLNFMSLQILTEIYLNSFADKKICAYTLKKTILLDKSSNRIFFAKYVHEYMFKLYWIKIIIAVNR